MELFYGDINGITENNRYFRRVLSTTPNMQLVVMSLDPMEEIGMEIHPYISQFIRVEKGIGMAIINDIYYPLSEGYALVIPLDSWHNIINTSSTEQLKLYTIYSPPNHPRDRVDVENPEAD